MLHFKLKLQYGTRLNAKYFLGIHENANISEIMTHNGFQYFKARVYFSFRLHGKYENNPFRGSSFLIVSAHFLTAVHL